MRVTTAFNRLLRLPGASVIDVSFSGEGVIVTVRLRRRRRVCSRCGQLGGHVHGWRVKRWRHLDLGAQRCIIECELRRLWCRDCGAQFEAVPWARPGSRFTRDFEDVVAWLAQEMAKSPIAGMLRIAWDSVGRIVERVVADHRDHGVDRQLEVGVEFLGGWIPIGVGAAQLADSEVQRVGQAGPAGCVVCREAEFAVKPFQEFEAGAGNAFEHRRYAGLGGGREHRAVGVAACGGAVDAAPERDQALEGAGDGLDAGNHLVVSRCSHNSRVAAISSARVAKCQ